MTDADDDSSLVVETTPPEPAQQVARRVAIPSGIVAARLQQLKRRADQKHATKYHQESLPGERESTSLG